MTKTVAAAEEAPAGAIDPTTQAYLDACTAGRAGLQDPPWLAARREKAEALFREHGIPHPKLEGFRTTNLGQIRHVAWPVPTTPAEVDTAQVERFRLEGAGTLAVSIDGRPAPDLSTTALPDGARLLPISTALEEAEALLSPHLADIVAHTEPQETLRALNTVAFADGWFLHVPKGVALDAPVQVLHLSTARDAPVAVHPRLLVVVDETAEATVVETFASLGEGPGLVNAVTEVALGQGAVVDHVKIQSASLQAHHTAALGVRQARDAKLRDLSVAIGADVSRYDLTTRLSEGSEVQMNGLFIAKGNQLVDHHTWIDHAEPHGTSIERYKGILDGKARGVFTGNVLVRADAQKTNSEQENRNLLLSREALVDTTPQLEIHADDVKCAHGSTIGQLPKSQLYYLRTRGFTEEEAKRVLTEAFAAEVLVDLREGPLRAHIESLIAQWFKHRQEAA